jgi:hypothetical protein
MIDEFHEFIPAIVVGAQRGVMKWSGVPDRIRRFARSMFMPHLPQGSTALRKLSASGVG